MNKAKWVQSWPKALERGHACEDCPWDKRDRAVVKFTYRDSGFFLWLCRSCCDQRIERHREYDRSAA